MKENNEKTLVTRAYMPPIEEYETYLKKIWDSRWLTNMGQLHNQLEDSLKEYLAVEDLELFTNGHLALEMALQAMELEGEVITTPYTFASTTHAIVRRGLTPVFCDIKDSDCTIDEKKLESLITDKTSAIVAVHVYGYICNVDAIEKIAKKHGLKVIYDAAHAFGVSYKKKGIGSFGDASMFSFHATKVFHTIEGGAVCFRDKSLKSRLYQLKNFGILDQETVAYVGGNAKMSEFQAAMGLCNLKHMPEIVEKRKKLTEHYRQLLFGHDGIRLIKEQDSVKYNYAYMPVIFEGAYNRDKIYNALIENNIYPRKYFYPCVNAYDCYKDRYNEDDTPVAKHISHSILTLPLYPDLSSDVVDKICDIIIKSR